ncbi:MAG: serpin family protein [bacterium]|jgi:serpin B
MTARIITAILILPAVVFICCGDQSTAPEVSPPRLLTEAEQQVVDSDNAFGLKLFREIAAAGKSDDNIFISPLSVSMALGMTANGAAGTTLEAMMNTMEFSGFGMHEMNSSYRSLIDLLSGLDPESVFNIANSIWYREGKVFKQEFYDTCRTYFDAVVYGLDFSREDAADTINGWVEEKTNGKITEILEPPIAGDVVMYLINAIYFLANWTYEFDPALTSAAPFYLSGGSSVTCELMQQPGDEEECEYMYYSNPAFQAIDLPYGGGYYSMTVLLPAPRADIDSLIGECTVENWSAWMDSLDEEDGRIYLPRFEIEYDILMNDVLTALGMGIAFSASEADFTGMRDEGELWISRVIHKTYVKVDEEGTEAAAATVVEMTETETGSFTMRVDRPFIFALREKHSGTILFIGKIANPEA